MDLANLEVLNQLRLCLKSEQSNLLFNYHPVKTKRQNRVVLYYKQRIYDAAALVFWLKHEFFPPKKLKFLDGNYSNLSLENLVICDVRGLHKKELMKKQHAQYMKDIEKLRDHRNSLIMFSDKRKEVERIVDMEDELNLKQHYIPNYRKYYKPLTKPEPIMGRAWIRHKNYWVSVSVSHEVTIADDLQARAARVLASGEHRYIAAVASEISSEDDQAELADDRLRQQYFRPDKRNGQGSSQFSPED